MRAMPVLVTLVLLSVWRLGAARADDQSTDRVLCHMATVAAERATGVPDQLLTAISRVESGRTDPATGRQDAWPWTINVEGAGHVYRTKQEAMAAVAGFQGQGIRSIDVGCLQINLKQHPEAFASLSDAFDPTTNAMFAARFLRSLFEQTGSWPHAAAAYHSLTPEVGRDYQNQVLAMWAQGDGPVPSSENHEQADRRPRPPRDVATASSGTTGSPFGETPSTFVAARYNPRPAILSSGMGRGLADYRGRPIALASRMMAPQHF